MQEQPVQPCARRPERRPVRGGQHRPAALAALAVEPDVRIKHGEQSARHTDRLPAHTQGHGAIPVHRIHELDPHQPRRARQVTKRPGPHQVINAVLISWLDQVSRRPAGGGLSGMGEAQLQQHLRGSRERQAVPDQGADRGGFQRLRV